MRKWRPVEITGLVLVIVMIFKFASCGEQPKTVGDLLDRDTMKDVKQVVLVVGNGWDSTTGTMSYYYVEDEQKWRAIETNIPVTLGKNGMAWGKGLPMSVEPGKNDPVKVEGDGRTPAGMFPLTFVFGYLPKDSLGSQENRPFTKMPYIGVDEMVECIDDVNSQYYNTVRINTPDIKDWTSSEKMRRNDDLYWMGVFVNHNSDPVEPGSGSCIFLHIWRSATSPTAGCTAMSQEDMIRLAHWLDPELNPVLIQVPAETYLPNRFE